MRFYFAIAVTAICLLSFAVGAPRVSAVACQTYNDCTAYGILTPCVSGNCGNPSGQSGTFYCRNDNDCAAYGANLGVYCNLSSRVGDLGVCQSRPASGASGIIAPTGAGASGSIAPTGGGAPGSIAPTGSGASGNIAPTGRGAPTGITLINPIGTTDLQAFLLKILDFVIYIGSIVIVAMLVWIGFLYVKARGNPGEISKAHSALLWTVVGALILLGSKAIALGIEATVRAISTGN